MQSSRTRLLQACYGFLLPLARLLLRSGISHTEFAEISRVAFVKVARSDYGIRGRQTNDSRVSAMTGIGRKEVRRLRELADRYPNSSRVEPNPLAQVLHRWYTDTAYLDRDGNPRKLRFRGGRASFTTLVEACPGDIPVGAIRVELVRTGAVVVDSRGGMRPTRRHIVGDALDERVISGLVRSLRALASTIAFNCGPNQNAGRIERFVQSDLPLGEGELHEIRNELRKRITEFTEDVDDLFANLEQSSDQSSKRIGVGVYYYEDD